MIESPFFSIITVTRNDAWQLQKTARSVFEQKFDDFEYLIADGASVDGSQGLLELWRQHGLAKRAVSEEDSGVYNAMNKAVKSANGKFVCFMNAGDVFADETVLSRVHNTLAEKNLDGLLGWGELNGQLWASWVETEAFKLASLGFCHQALYVERKLLLDTPFDERPFKTDSDTRQLAELIEKNARIPILRDVLAVRGGEPGLSADLERSAKSILNTLVEEYPDLSESMGKQILSFRRRCEGVGQVLDILHRAQNNLSLHLSFMILDTLFLKQSKNLSEATCRMLIREALAALSQHGAAENSVKKLLDAQRERFEILKEKGRKRERLNQEVARFEQDETRRLRTIKEELPPRAKRKSFSGVVSLTTFPARITTVRFVIESLLEQSIVPRAIHLCIGLDEFPSRKWLPTQLLALEKHGLEIRFARRTFHQYDKYLHNCDFNASKPFVIIDDDVIYPADALEKLLSGHEKYPECVIANRAHEIGMISPTEFSPYSEWRREIHYEAPSFRLFPTGAGGVLYPPGFLKHPDSAHVDSILRYAPYADDIWLKFCGLSRRTRVFATDLSEGSRWYRRYTPTMRAGTLMATNVERGLNDLQIERCHDWLKQQISSFDIAELLNEKALG